MKVILVVIYALCCLNGLSQNEIRKKVTVQSKEGNKEIVLLTFRCLPDKLKLEQPLLLVDDEQSEVSAIHLMNIKDIDRIEVVQGNEAARKYGDKAKGGAVLIYMKSSATKRAYI